MISVVTVVTAYSEVGMVFICDVVLKYNSSLFCYTAFCCVVFQIFGTEPFGPDNTGKL